MQGVDTPRCKKILFGVLLASRKLRHYFQAHPIRVVTSLPLERILKNREATGRIVEWALELSRFNLAFVNSSAVKSRLPADFVAKWTPTPKDYDDIREASSL